MGGDRITSEDPRKWCKEVCIEECICRFGLPKELVTNNDW